MHTGYQVSSWQSAPPPKRRNRAAFISGAAILATLITLGAVAVWQVRAAHTVTPPSWVENPPKARPVVVADLPGRLGAFDPAGNVVTIDGDEIHFFNPETRDEVRPPISHGDADKLEFTTDGSLLAVMCACGGRSGVVDIIEVSSGEGGVQGDRSGDETQHGLQP